MSDETQTDADKIAALEKQVADLSRQIQLLNAQLQAAINQRNANANDAIILAAQLKMASPA